MYGLMVRFGHYYVEGVGYPTIQDILTGAEFPLYLLLLLFLLKLTATSLTLGTGASGGIFSPCLFLGATVGAAYGVLLQHWFPSLESSPPAFAVVGMASVVGGATGAARAAVVMIFEMTFNYAVVAPMILAVAISYGIKKSTLSYSIYTPKLILRGEPVPEALREEVRFEEVRENATRTAPKPLDSSGYTLRTGQGDSRMIVYRLDQMREKFPL